MTRALTFRCDRCCKVEAGEHAYMSSPPTIRFDGGEPDWSDIELSVTYEHCCGDCQTDLSDLLVGAIAEWKEME